MLLLPPAGPPLASHPALLLAQRVASVHPQQLIHTPVIVPLEEEDLAVGPGEGGVNTGGQAGEEGRQRFGVEAPICVGQFVPLPVL